MPIGLIEQVVTAALIVVLFDSGLGTGWRRFHEAAVPFVALSGMIATTGAVMLMAHYDCGLSWRTPLPLDRS
ncbi:hypothetical protein [Streptomyces sp. NBC_01497]|uniref:hypothetical protein n=1 Tax=Streptomyces sp. NBC_01497 TaxID=2903885 RepID=UPI002E31D142|nr:hypothetical protein [Streptomyces sp. NBC_01497]